MKDNEYWDLMWTGDRTVAQDKLLKAEMKKRLKQMAKKNRR